MTRPGRRALGAAAAILALAAVSLYGTGPAQAATTTRAVSGTIFWDRDNDGTRDTGEPGVAGIRVHSGAADGLPSAVTDAAGRYSLTGLPTSGALLVETGWFRSQCAALTCAAGPGPDNDFPTANQFIKFSLATLTADRSGLNVGLLPDWPGATSAAPAAVAGVVPSNPVDVAARLSWATSTCAQGKLNICAVGDTYTVSGQIHNQGTSSLSGIEAVLDLPPGDSFAGSSPLTAVTLTTTATSPGITSLTVHDYDAVNHSVVLAFGGNLVPGGLIKIIGKGKVTSGPGTPGCSLVAPTSACPTVEPQGAPLLLAVTHVDQAGDPDSFAPGCTALTAVTQCPTGIHDKQVEPDEVDGVGHNVADSVGTTTAFDLVGRVDRLGSATTTAGSKQAVRISVFNAGPTVVRPGWVSTTIFPKGAAPAVPKASAARTCAKSTANGYPVLRCTGKAPLGPGVTSFATDVTWTIPASSAAGVTLRVLTYVEPTAQAGESIPMGPLPTAPVDAASTSTNNDASRDFVVVR